VRHVATVVPVGLSVISLDDLHADCVLRQGNLDRFLGYFQLLKRSLRSSPRAVVLEHLRSLFKIFLDAFDVTKVSSPKSDEVGDSGLL
jgi:hypothetical protein